MLSRLYLMSDKRDHIEIVTLNEYGQDESPFIVSSLCNLGDTFFEHQESPHRHDFYSIYWIKCGHLRHTIDTVTHEIQDNTLFFLAPGQVHKMEFSEKADGYMIAFHDAFMCLKDQAQLSSGINSGLFFNNHFSSVLTLPEDQQADFEWLVKAMVKEVHLKENDYESAFHGLLRYLLVLSSRIQNAADTFAPDTHLSHNSTLFLQFKTLIEEKFRDLKNVSDYAGLLHIKPVLLNEVSKQLSGITAGEHIRNRIILEAQRYLYNTDLTAKEIAYNLGFEDPHYFSRFFKKYTNQTPSEFKEVSRASGAFVHM